MSNDYGVAQFYRSDCWPRNGLKEYWLLDPGVAGNSIGSGGDFETWTGAEGGCTDCPEGWTCDCTTYGGDINQETTHIYNLNTSARLDASGVFASLMLQIHTFEANTAYQISFCYKGTGYEDLAFIASNVTTTDSYNFTSDTWTAPLTYMTFTNISADWTCATAYITTGVTEKTSYFCGFAALTSDGDYIYIDNVKIQKLNSPDVTGARGNILSVPVGSDQNWGSSESAMMRVGSGPSGKSGMKLDGVDDFLSRADDDTFDPATWDSGGYFSVGCRVMTDTVAAGSDTIISKWGGVGQRSWYLDRSGSNLTFVVSDDGTNSDWNNATVYIVDTLQSFVSTFDPSGGSGACENNLYYDAYQVDTDATMTECVPFDSTAPLEIGARVGTLNWSGSILECTLWEKELTAVEANKYINPFFPGVNDNDGFYVDTCSQAVSHCTCDTHRCRPGTANACQPEGTGVMALFGSYSEICVDNAFENNTGSDDTPVWPDWTQSEVNGDGLANITGYRPSDYVFYGSNSARLKISGLTSLASLSQCIACSPATDYYAYLKAKKIAGTSAFSFAVEEHSDAVCGNFLLTNTIADAVDVPHDWTEYGDIFTTGAGTGSLKITITNTTSPTSNADLVVDTVSLKEASIRTPWIECPNGSAYELYNSRQYELFNPLSSYIESESDYAYNTGFCISAWIYSDWSDDGVAHYILYSPGTGGNNDVWWISKAADDNLYFSLYDSAGGLRSSVLAATSTNWTTGNWKYIEVCSNNTDNLLSAHHYNVNNSTWYAWGAAAGAGTGIQTGQASNLHIGHASNATYFDGFQSEIHVSPYSAIYPMAGWNSGKPPVNGLCY